MTQEGLSRIVEECRDYGFQDLLLDDTLDMLWPEDCTVPPLIFERDELEYFSSQFGMADVLDIVWSSCCNGLN